MTRLPPAHPVRVGILLLALTGCRVAELDRLNPRNLAEGWIYWQPGKNQRGWRRELLPRWFLQELALYRETHRVPQARMLGYQGHVLRRYFNRDVRPFLGRAWNTKRFLPNGRRYKEHINVDSYTLQLKGFRKSFATTIFYREYQRWGDAGVALEFTSKRMRHSTKGMTAYHYLEEFDAAQVEKWDQFTRTDGPRVVQQRLPDYFTYRRARG